MRKTRKCAFCGKEFTCNSGSQKYCSEHCAETAKAQQKKKRQDFIKAAGPVIDLASQEYLSFSKAAILMGCTRQYVYKLVNEGKLSASRISSRMAFIRKADIEQMLAGNPYHRVLLTPMTRKVKTTSSLPSKKGKNQVPETSTPPAEPLDYISGEDVMTIYKVKKSWLYTSAKNNQVPICKIAGKNYYSRKHMDEIFGSPFDLDSVNEWIVAGEAETLYGMNRGALRSYVHRHTVPTKREYGQTYYSKDHLDKLRRTDLVSDVRYFTTAEAAEKYGMTRSNICAIIKKENLTKMRVGVQNLVVKAEIDRVMENRMAQFGSYHLQ